MTGQEDTMPEKLGRVYFDLWFKGHQSFNGKEGIETIVWRGLSWEIKISLQPCPPRFC